MKQFKGVIFDLVGTLLDTLEDIADSMNSVLNRLGYPEHDRETYKYLGGDGLEKLVIRALPEDHRNQLSLARCIVAMRGEYRKRWPNKSHPYEGIPELLNSLSRSNIKMALLSTKPSEFTKLTIDKLLPHWQFEVVWGSMPSIPKKPDPTGALKIAKILEVPPRGFLFLGDTGVDMETANAAGMYPVGTLWGFRTAEELIASGAKTLIKKPADLLEIL